MNEDFVNRMAEALKQHRGGLSNLVLSTFREDGAEEFVVFCRCGWTDRSMNKPRLKEELSRHWDDSSHL